MQQAVLGEQDLGQQLAALEGTVCLEAGHRRTLVDGLLEGARRLTLKRGIFW
jgi:hypothetical protein